MDDLQSAISYVISKGYKKIGLFGYSLGTLICLKNYTPKIKTMILLGALTVSMKYNWNDFFTQEQMNELKTNGSITEYIYGQVRKKIIIDRQMIEGFEAINQNELLSGIKCPILIIHGADHSFMDYFDIVVEKSIKWVKKHL